MRPLPPPVGAAVRRHADLARRPSELPCTTCSLAPEPPSPAISHGRTRERALWIKRKEMNAVKVKEEERKKERENERKRKKGKNNNNR
jgi:hypothetical protein